MRNLNLRGSSREKSRILGLWGKKRRKKKKEKRAISKPGKRHFAICFYVSHPFFNKSIWDRYHYYPDILQGRKLRGRKIRELAKSHTVKWWNKYLNSGSVVPEFAILTTILYCLKNQVNNSQGK